MVKVHHAGIFVAIYFLIASILSYFMQLVSTLAVGALLFQSMLNVLLICNLYVQTVIEISRLHGKNNVI